MRTATRRPSLSPAATVYNTTYEEIICFDDFLVGFFLPKSGVCCIAFIQQVGGFPTDDGALAGGSPAIVADQASLPDYAVTGDEVGDRVGTHRAAHGAHRCRVVNGAGDAGIGTHRTVGDTQQSFPDLYLEIRAFDQDAQRA